MPTIRRAEEPSRLARSQPSRTARAAEPSRGVTRDLARPTRSIARSESARTALPRTGTSVRAPSSNRTISQRSTLTEFRTRSSATYIRGDSTQPHAALPRSTFRSGGFGHSSGFHPHGHHGHDFQSHIGFSVRVGSWWWGHGFFGHPHIYYGTHSIAILGVGGWHMVPYGHGWFGVSFGPRCYFFPHWRRHHHSFFYNGFHCRIHRPYWYGYSRWYDWHPYGYGYSSLTYDSIYDEGYETGYDRGYEEGAEDSGDYRDDRRRDRIGGSYEKTPDPDKDRTRGDAATEYRNEMDRGSDAFSKGDYAAATNAFKEAVILDPSSADARYSLAMSAFAQGKYSFSAFALRRAVVLDPKGSNIDLPKAFGSPEALKGYQDHLAGELKITPDDPDLLLLHGFTSLRTGDAKAAAESLDKALQQTPQDRAAKTLYEEALDAMENE